MYEFIKCNTRLCEFTVSRADLSQPEPFWVTALYIYIIIIVFYVYVRVSSLIELLKTIVCYSQKWIFYFPLKEI